MLNKIIFFSTKNKLIVGLMVFALIIYGSIQLTRLPIDAVPDITNNQVQVITVAPSYGATDIERLVTFPIEQANSNLPGLIEIRSFSRFGLSLVTIVFNDETDIYWARQQVSERLQKVKDLIPKGIGNPELGPVTTGLGEIYQYVIRAKEGFENKYTDVELRTIQDWIVRRQLLGVKGVAEVSSFGGKLKQYEIAVDPNKLKSYNITINDVFSALESNNQNTGGAYIEKGPTVLYIRTEGLYGSITDIGNTPIKLSEKGTPLFVKDVAEVRTGHAIRFGAMCYNDKGEVSGAIVMMLKGANSSEVIVNVKERIAQIQKTLPAGVVIEPFLDRTKMVNNAISTVEKNLLEGALIVIFILVLFLGNLRAGLLVASVIPLSMLFAVIMMNLFGVSGNLMSLGALDFGLIVDGAVIIVEAVLHQLAHGKRFSSLSRITQSEMDEEVNHSAGKMMNSAVFGQIIILIVYLPILSLQGIEGKMFKPMAQTVAFALLGAFLLSLTYIPMMSTLVLSKKLKHGMNFSDRLMARIENWFMRTLGRILTIPKTIIAIVLVLFSLAIITLTTLGGEFIPALEEGDFAIETRLLTGTNLNTSIQNTQKAAGLLKANFPEVEKVVTKIGSGEVPTDPMPMDASDMMVILKDKSEWTSANTFNELAEKMGAVLEQVPGLTYSFQYPVQMRFNELMTGAKQDVVCKIFGEDLDTLALYAQRMGNIIAKIDGAKDLYVEAVSGMPQMIINYDRAALSQYGLAISDVNRIINTAFAGQTAGMVFEGEKRFDLVVRLTESIRSDYTSVKDLLIPTPSGDQVPLYQIADVQVKEGPNQIQREDAKRRIIVGFNVRGRDVQSIVNELQQKVAGQIKFPAGYYPTYGGAFENLNAAKKRLAVAVPISLVLIFLLLYFAFNSMRQGMLIYSAIPLSAIGGIFALYFRGMPFSISAGVGFIALFGVAVLNGIVLISEFNRLRESGIEDLREVVIKGTRVRLRPVLMTAMVASLGFLPMALSNGSGAEVQRPLASVVIGGLLIATFLTLFVLPLLYIMFEKGTHIKQHQINVSALLFIGLTLVFSNSVFAQRSISLNEAMEMALKNNQNFKNEKLKMEYQKKMIGSATDIPLTTIGAEYGQINSSYSDNRISVGQSFNFPTVYANKKKMAKEDYNTAVLTVALKEKELRLLVSELFFKYQIVMTRLTLLRSNDSLFSDFKKKTELRFEKGEGDLLEKATAENQAAQINMQMDLAKLDLEKTKLEFLLAINSSEDVAPDLSEKISKPVVMLDTTMITSHPFVKLSEQQKQQSRVKLKLERSRLLPDLSLVYNNMSMRGVGADNISYTQSTRFQSAQVGLGIPLFFGSTKARVSSAKVGMSIAEEDYSATVKKLRTDYAKALAEYNHWAAMVDYYQSKGLANSETILATANSKFAKGEINYLEWVLLNHQATGIKNDHISALENLQKSILQLNYLSSK